MTSQTDVRPEGRCYVTELNEMDKTGETSLEDGGKFGIFEKIEKHKQKRQEKTH